MPEIKNYQKKPTVVEAVQVDGTEEGAQQVAAWLKVPFRPDVDPSMVHVVTSWGSATAHTGDYIVREGTDEDPRYDVIDREIFEEEYEEVDVDLPRSDDELPAVDFSEGDE